MKKFLLVICIATCSNIFAQTIPNGGFETWQPYNTDYPTEVPQHWWSFDLFAAAFNSSYTPNACIKTTQSHSGSFAALMQTNISGGDTVGGAFFCSDSVGFQGMPQGFSINSRPATLSGYYKFTGIGNDYAEVALVTTKWNGNHRDTLTSVIYTINANASSYTQFSIPITYSSNLVPDTAYIATGILNVVNSENTHVGTQFYLDDLAFGGSIATGIKEYLKEQNLVSIFPNPFSSKTNIHLDPSIDAASASLVIYDIQGRSLKQINQFNSNQTEIDRKDLANGIYFYSLYSNNTLITKGKLIIE